MKTCFLAAGLAVFAATAQAAVISHNFTLSNGGFTASSTGGSNWTYVPGMHWKTGADAANYADGTRTELLSPTFTAAGGAINVSFTHFMNAEGVFDGGVLAYSLNSGAFNYVGNAAFTANGYNAFASSDLPTRTYLGTPAGSNMMLSGTFSSQTSTANLGTFNAGDQVQVLFRFATDGSVERIGWHLTDFTIDTGGPTNGIPEPSTISLIAAGAALMFLRCRK